MKTNQLLTRQMADFAVMQRTCDSMFNATALLKQWNESKNESKEINKFFDNNATKDFINALIIEENLHTQNSTYVKSRASRGNNAGTWMHPLLFIDFAMWLNPSFKVKVLRFVSDQLLKYRNDAGDAYIEMTGAISKIVERSLLQNAIQTVAKALNHIVYGNHQSNIRNLKADEMLMKELVDLEIKVAMLINEGFIKSYAQLLEYLRKQWLIKNQPKFLTA